MRPPTPAETPRGKVVDAAIEELLRTLRDIEEDEEWSDLLAAHPAPRSNTAATEVPPNRMVLHAPPGYRRDSVGRWRYTRTGTYVPAARDVRVSDVIPTVHVGDHQLVHAGAVRLYPVLEFLLQYPIRVYGATVMLEVPIQDWAEAGRMVLGVSAPELAPEQLLDTAAVAALCRVSQRTVSAYLARGRFVEPVARIGPNPVWSLPVVLQWQARSDRTSQ